MAVKATGLEFKKFYDDKAFWDDDTYHEDAYLSVDGVEQLNGIDVDLLSDTAIVVIEGGAMVGPQWEDEGPTLETYFKRWRKKQTSTVFVVECDNSKLEAVKSAIKAAGGRVI